MIFSTVQRWKKTVWKHTYWMLHFHFRGVCVLTVFSVCFDVASLLSEPSLATIGMRVGGMSMKLPSFSIPSSTIFWLTKWLSHLIYGPCAQSVWKKRYLGEVLSKANTPLNAKHRIHVYFLKMAAPTFVQNMNSTRLQSVMIALHESLFKGFDSLYIRFVPCICCHIHS